MCKILVLGYRLWVDINLYIIQGCSVLMGRSRLVRLVLIYSLCDLVLLFVAQELDSGVGNILSRMRVFTV